MKGQRVSMHVIRTDAFAVHPASFQWRAASQSVGYILLVLPASAPLSIAAIFAALPRILRSRN